MTGTLVSGKLNKTILYMWYDMTLMHYIWHLERHLVISTALAYSPTFEKRYDRYHI